MVYRDNFLGPNLLFDYRLQPTWKPQRYSHNSPLSKPVRLSELRTLAFAFETSLLSTPDSHELILFLGRAPLLGYWEMSNSTPYRGCIDKLIHDAIMVPLPGERERVSEHFRRLGMSDEQINQIRRKVWRGRIRHTILEPERLYPRIKSTVVFFSFLRDPDTGTCIALVHNKNDIYR